MHRRYAAFHTSGVYFAQLETGGPIKIGYSDNVARRVVGLQGAHPYRIDVLLILSGTSKTERELHSMFRGLRLLGEWFKDAPELLEFITKKRADGDPLYGNGRCMSAWCLKCNREGEREPMRLPKQRDPMSEPILRFDTSMADRAARAVFNKGTQ